MRTPSHLVLTPCFRLVWHDTFVLRDDFLLLSHYPSGCYACAYYRRCTSSGLDSLRPLSFIFTFVVRVYCESKVRSKRASRAHAFHPFYCCKAYPILNPCTLSPKNMGAVLQGLSVLCHPPAATVAFHGATANARLFEFCQAYCCALFVI